MTRERILKMFADRGYILSITYYPYGVAIIIRLMNGMKIAELVSAGMNDRDALYQFLQMTDGFGMLDKTTGWRDGINS
jgi:hypothetical protein